MDKSILKEAPIKVLLAIRQGQVGGGESHVLELVQGFRKTHVTPIVLSFTPGEMIDRLQELGAETHVIETTTPFDVRVWPKVKKLFQALAPDIIHAHGTRAASNTFWPAKQLGLPLIYTIHGWSFHQGQGKILYNARLYMEHFLTRQASLNICVSENNQREGRELFGLKRSMTIHNGVNLNKFSPTLQFADIRKEYNIPNDLILIGFISRITYQKNTLNFIRAIKLLSERVVNFKVLIVGDGDEKETAIKLSEELGLTDKILFVNFRKDVPAILKAIDIYCLPSWWEGFSIGLLEAMAMKKCVVCSDIGGNREIVENTHNGYYCNPGDVNSIAEPLALLCKNDELRTRLAENALTTISMAFSSKSMVRKVEEVYAEATKK